MKIDEPRTPFVRYNPTLDKNMDMDGKVLYHHIGRQSRAHISQVKRWIQSAMSSA